MEETEIRQLIERLRTLGRDDSQCEVKTCENELSKDVWESVSAFANTRGGILLLGLSEKNGFLPVPSFKIEPGLRPARIWHGGRRGAGKT